MVKSQVLLLLRYQDCIAMTAILFTYDFTLSKVNFLFQITSTKYYDTNKSEDQERT